MYYPKAEQKEDILMNSHILKKCGKTGDFAAHYKCDIKKENRVINQETLADEYCSHFPFKQSQSHKYCLLF